MNPNRRPQIVPVELVDLGMQFGRNMASHYAAGGSPRSRAVSGNRGTERNPERLAQGKIGECALALYWQMDPLLAVKWTVDHADAGYDLLLPGGLRVDVKTTYPPYNVIWSNTINDIYEDVRFDYIVSVSIAKSDFSRTWIEGWISKGAFAAAKMVADGHGIGGNLEPGTWFMPKEKLQNIEALMPLARRIAVGRDAA